MTLSLGAFALTAGVLALAAEAARKTLIVYFSMPETDKPDDMTREEANSTVVIDGKVLGNTQYVAQLIQERTGGDLFRIVPQRPYPREHTTLIDLAKKEQQEKARPAIAGSVDTSPYDTIFLGYPNWWADLPMIVYTFLEEHNLSGKTIIPFCTHGGSGFSRTVQSIQEKQPGAKVQRNGFALSRSRMEKAPALVEEWLGELDLKKHG